MKDKSINLNLISYLDVLVAERSVSKAAKKVGLSQPAMSNILSELKKLYNDPLLVRGGGGMIPTKKALELVKPIRQGLSLLQGTLFKSLDFDPAKDTKTFKIVANDYVGAVMLPDFFKNVGNRYPNLRFEIMAWGRHNSPKSLVTNQLDVMVGFHHELPTGYYEEVLFDERFVSMVRKDHPVVTGDTISRDQFLELIHIKVEESEGALRIVDAELDRIGLSRTIGLRVPHFTMYPFILAKSDMIITTTYRIAKLFSRVLPLKIIETPLDLPGAVVKQVWHERVHRDPAHTWLRNQIKAVAEKV